MCILYKFSVDKLFSLFTCFCAGVLFPCEEKKSKTKRQPKKPYHNL